MKEISKVDQKLSHEQDSVAEAVQKHKVTPGIPSVLILQVPYYVMRKYGTRASSAGMWAWGCVLCSVKLACISRQAPSRRYPARGKER